MNSGLPAEYSLDFYSILEVKAAATPDQIRQAYKRLALKWHPDKNKGSSSAQEKFKQIKGAYEVLSDENKKLQYDALRTGRGGSSHSSAYHRSSWQAPSSYRSSHEDPFNFSRNFYNDFQYKPRGQDHSHTFQCTLEELYNGTSKRMKVRRQVLDSCQRPHEVERVVTVVVPPGAHEGAHYRFQGLADEQHGYTPGDVVFVLRQKPHEHFTRHGDDLLLKIELSLAAAICGASLSVPHLDGSNIHVRLKDLEMMRQPQAEDGSRTLDIVKLGRGMPTGSTLNSRYGQLTIRVRLAASTLTEEQRAALQAELALAAGRQHHMWWQVGFGVCGSLLVLSMLRGGRPLKLAARLARGVAVTIVKLLLL